jgi:hypothetical protein
MHDCYNDAIAGRIDLDMKSVLATLVLSTALVCAGCSTVYNVQYDYDRDADFSRFQTYHWLSAEESAESSSLDIKRVRKAVDNALASKGLRETSDNPDLLVSGELGAANVVSIKSRGHRQGYGRSSRVSSYNYEEGSLTLSFADGTSKELVWQGTANAEIDQVQTPEKREKLIDEAVTQMLKNFPPPRSK